MEDIQSISDVNVRFSAPWAEGRPVLVFLIAIALAVLGVLFYAKYQKSFGGASNTSARARGFLAVARGLVLALIVIILAEPVISASVTERRKKTLVWLFDGTDSMNINDHIPDEELGKIAKAVNSNGADDNLSEATRLDLVKKVVARSENLFLGDDAEEYRVRAYVTDEGGRVSEIVNTTGDELDLEELADGLEAKAQRTLLGTAFDQLSKRHPSETLAGLVVVSDFNDNGGIPVTPHAEELNTKIFTVGVGPRDVINLEVLPLNVDKVLKKDEEVTVSTAIRQNGLTGQTARVQLLARRLGSAGGLDIQSKPRPVGAAKTVQLTAPRQKVELSFTPSEEGRFMLQVKVDLFDGEVEDSDNIAESEIEVTDDSLKLFFVEYEPTWEWRFVKEVFHRDPLIGKKGFRTFLRSADFKVRRTNELFVETLVRPRSEFFENDVIFLSDVPAEMLSDHFQELLIEFVHKGGGLVVMCGPRFTATSLSGTRIANELLPVKLDPALRPRNGKFRMEFTPLAKDSGLSFAQLSDDESENERAWDNMDPIPWFQPVYSTQGNGTTVLATIPTEKCAADDVTPQPFIAVREFAGSGKVIFLGSNEFWRLRRKYGEKYYRKFWGQMIYQLGLESGIGGGNRFKIKRVDSKYMAGDKVRITVQAYDKNYEPLEVTELSALHLPANAPVNADAATEFKIPVSQDGVVFETEIPVYAEGSHRILVTDPVTNERHEMNVVVEQLAIERRNPVRSFDLQEKVANKGSPGSRALELYELTTLASHLTPETYQVPAAPKTVELWNTWLVLILVIGLLLAEWLGRKLVNLR
jgi:hypothetical protein